MTTFRKGTWQANYINGVKVTLSGYLSTNFGICKAGPRGGYRVSHLPSDTGVSLFSRDTLAEAKAIVAKAEAAFNWSATSMTGIAEANNLEPRAFTDAVRDLNRAALVEHMRAA